MKNSLMPFDEPVPKTVTKIYVDNKCELIIKHRNKALNALTNNMFDFNLLNFKLVASKTSRIIKQANERKLLESLN